MSGIGITISADAESALMQTLGRLAAFDQQKQATRHGSGRFEQGPIRTRDQDV